MKSVEQILARLESLASEDRQWIIARLPDHAKSLLMDEITSTDGGTHTSASASSGPPGNSNQLEKTSPHVAAAILESESVWVIATLLQSATKDWAISVVNALPGTLRSSVIMAMRDSSSAPGAVVASLRNTLLRRAAMEQSSIAPEETQSWWRQLIGAMRGPAP